MEFKKGVVGSRTKSKTLGTITIKEHHKEMLFAEGRIELFVLTPLSKKRGKKPKTSKK